MRLSDSIRCHSLELEVDDRLAGPAAADDVDECVDAAPPLDGRGDGVARRLLVGHVGDDRERLLTDAARDRVEPGGLDVDERHGVSGGGEARAVAAPIPSAAAEMIATGGS